MLESESAEKKTRGLRRWKDSWYAMKIIYKIKSEISFLKQTNPIDFPVIF